MSLLDFSGGELSSRHLPDDSDTLSNISNTSFSFQIPQGVSITDKLLAEEDGDDFFRNAQVDAADISVAEVLSPVSSSALDKPTNLRDWEICEEGTCSRVVTKLVDMPISLTTVTTGDLDHQRLDAVLNATRIQRPKFCMNTKPLIGSTSTQDISSALFFEHSNSQGESISASTTQPEIPVEERQVALDEKSSQLNNNKLEEVREQHTRKTGGGNIERKRPIPRSRRTVIEGGIIKPRISQSKKALEISSRDTANPALLHDSEPAVTTLAKRTKAVRGCHEVEHLLEDASTSSIFPARGVAARLMEYGQKFLNGNSARHDLPSNCTSDDYQMLPKEANDNIQDDRDKPLTLSQLSPRKPAGTISPMPEKSDVNSAPILSPVRPAIKRRVVIVSSSDEPKLKKSKGDDFESDGRARSKPKTISKPRLPSTRMQKQVKSGMNSRFASSSRVQSNSNSMRGPSILKAKNRAISNGTGWNDDVRLPDEKNATRPGSSLSSTSSIKSLTSRKLDQQDKADKLLDTSVPFTQRLGPSLRTNTDTQAEQQHTKEKETAPLGSRSMSRCHVQTEKHRFYHPPPNFKAIHAAFDASFAQRKENIHPIVPLPMQWQTDRRMQERKKFDEKVREREREIEKEEEERKKFREIEEEREVKELRKRLVVKAHDVPGWYSKMPKSKRKEHAEVTEK